MDKQKVKELQALFYIMAFGFWLVTLYMGFLLGKLFYK